MQYLDITLTPDAEPYAVAGLILQAVHGVIASGKSVLATAFPSWKDTASIPALSPKDQIRVFGEKETLQALAVRREIVRLTALGEIRVSQALETPAQAQRFMRFRRTRQEERALSPSRARRHAVRAAMRGDAQMRVSQPKPSRPQVLRVGVHSFSTGQPMSLHVSREEVSGPSQLGILDSYGLSKGETAMPVF